MKTSFPLSVSAWLSGSLLGASTVFTCSSSLSSPDTWVSGNKPPQWGISRRCTLKDRLKKFVPVLGAVGAVAATASHSFAAAMLDFTGMTTAVTAEIQPAIVAALPIAGTILAVGIGVKLYKRFVK